MSLGSAEEENDSNAALIFSLVGRLELEEVSVENQFIRVFSFPNKALED